MPARRCRSTTPSTEDGQKDAGLNDKLRQEIWDHQEKYLGAVIKYRYQPYGMKDRPRFPTFIGFRDVRDM
jgi:DNA ligase-1